METLQRFGLDSTPDLRTYDLEDGYHSPREPIRIAVDTVLIRLRRSGPRGILPEDPHDLEALARWFRKAVHRQIGDQVGQRARERKGATAAKHQGRQIAHVGDHVHQPLVLERGPDGQPRIAVEDGGGRDLTDERLASIATARQDVDDAIEAEALARCASRPAYERDFREGIELLRDTVRTEATVAEAARQLVDAAPPELTATIAKRIGEAGLHLDAAALALLRARGCAIPKAVELNCLAQSGNRPLETAVDERALLAAARQAAIDATRVNLDTRFKNYRTAIMNRLTRRAETEHWPPGRLDRAQVVVHHELQLQQKVTDRLAKD
ncbi:MAG: hypothetical protein FJ100_11265 [Deltaproteobacteria bacterium]|nr:hypothetical protein [Deltaproteobacteria bacterium]